MLKLHEVKILHNFASKHPLFTQETGFELVLSFKNQILRFVVDDVDVVVIVVVVVVAVVHAVVVVVDDEVAFIFGS